MEFTPRDICVWVCGYMYKDVYYIIVYGSKKDFNNYM